MNGRLHAPRGGWRGRIAAALARLSRRTDAPAGRLYGGGAESLAGPSYALALALALLAGCTGGNPEPERVVEGGDAERGRLAAAWYGCGYCHAMPGDEAAPTIQGPPLNEWARRQYIAGAVRNTPENLMLWIIDPHAIEPGTAMPALGVTEQDARDLAAYLYTFGDANALGPSHLFPARWLHGLATGGGGGEKETDPWYNRAAGLPDERQPPLEPPPDSMAPAPRPREGEGGR